MLMLDKFNVRIVNTGDKYGLNDCLVNDRSAMVEFYDVRFPHTKFGQFISRYYTSTILEQDAYPSGLCLDSGTPAWTVPADDMLMVAAYIRSM